LQIISNAIIIIIKDKNVTHARKKKARFEEKPEQTLSCYFELTKKCSSTLLQIISNAIIIIIIKEVKGNST
jgi:hypothetical protein